jgi:hypothetical protein
MLQVFYDESLGKGIKSCQMSACGKETEYTKSMKLFMPLR